MFFLLSWYVVLFNLHALSLMLSHVLSLRILQFFSFYSFELFQNVKIEHFFFLLFMFILKLSLKFFLFNSLKISCNLFNYSDISKMLPANGWNIFRLCSFSSLPSLFSARYFRGYFILSVYKSITRLLQYIDSIIYFQ